MSGQWLAAIVIAGALSVLVVLWDHVLDAQRDHERRITQLEQLRCD